MNVQEESQQQMITLAVCNKIGLKMEVRSFENSLSSIESEGCEILKQFFYIGMDQRGQLC